MNPLVFTIEKRSFLLKTAITGFLILIAAGSSLFAQYRGAPVKKDRLVQAIRSRQLQTRDIVTIINANGVDFQLTPAIRRTLLAAGARPEVIKAVADNPRLPSKNDIMTAKAGKNNGSRRQKIPSQTYDDLLSQAIYSYKDQKNPKGAVRILEAAVKTKPQDPAAYQMLGFVYLYGLNNRDQAEKVMREAIMNGGSAVFRVFHDDNGKFTDRCTGSLYISRDTMRFESDENEHTFETSIGNVDRIKLDTESTRAWKKHSVFKVFLKIGKDKAKFRFAPLNGELAESKMVERFFAASNSDIDSAISANSLNY